MVKYPRVSRLAALVSAGILFACALNSQADTRAVYRVDVNLVALTFSVTDKSGNHVTGLKPSDLRISEDGIPQKIASFAEGSSLIRLLDNGPGVPGTGVFILFDTSNRMYSNYPYVRDAIADFIRLLAPADSAAIYSFSRNLFRASRLTQDHVKASGGLDNISAGDDAALFNAVLLTLRDAALVPGRKAIVVFSNSPDTASVLAPDDVARVAENEGVPIYVISTRDATQDPVMFGALQYLTTRSGGKLYCARGWQRQADAFKAVREDIKNSYTAYYYPSPNPNDGFRKIKIELTAPGTASYRIFARPGYQPRRDSSNHTN